MLRKKPTLMTTDTCPNNEFGHRYFIFKVVESFVPYVGIDKPYDEQVYVKKEHALLGCNCGSVIKNEVKQNAAY